MDELQEPLILNELIKLREKALEEGYSRFSSEDKKKFWKLVGRIKRLPDADKELVEIASEIREGLHAKRFGKPLSFLAIELPLSICGVVMIVLSFWVKKGGDLQWISIIYLVTLLLYQVLFVIPQKISLTKQITIFLISLIVYGVAFYFFYQALFYHF